MPRTMQQERITLVIRQDLMEQAQAESEASALNMAELMRRAIDLYLTTFPPPEQYQTGELLAEVEDLVTGEKSFPVNRKYPFHINPGLLGELDRYAFQTKTSADEVANRSLVLYMASLTARRQAAQDIEDQAGDPGAAPEPGEDVEIEPLPEDPGAVDGPASEEYVPPDIQEPAPDGDPVEPDPEFAPAPA